MKRKSCTIRAAQPERLPDCVTVTRTGGVILPVKNCACPNAKGTAGDKLVRWTAYYDDTDAYTDTS